MFIERLRKYRESLNLTKRQFADKLDVSESYYNMIENNKRNPSESFIHKIVTFSEQPEEFWKYGLNKQEYISSRSEFKSTKKAVDQIIELGLIDDVNNLFNGNYQQGTLEELLIAALKTDIEYLIKNKNQ